MPVVTHTPPLRTQRLHIYFSWKSAVTPIVSGEYSHHRDRAVMASRVSFTQARIEAELERYRAECQWDKMPMIIEQMKVARIHEDGECSTPGGYKVEVSPGRFRTVFNHSLQKKKNSLNSEKKLKGSINPLPNAMPTIISAQLFKFHLFSGKFQEVVSRVGVS